MTGPGPAAPIRRTTARGLIYVAPSPGQSQESLEQDAARSERFQDDLAERGVQSFHSWYRWAGPVKAMMSKEVGPPPWPWPKVLLRCQRGPVTATAGIGWRSTAYQLTLMWAPR